MDSEHRTARIAAAAGSVLGILPILYVLSIGPAARWAQGHPGSGFSNALERFYYPVIWLHENTPLREPLEWYVETWGVR